MYNYLTEEYASDPDPETALASLLKAEAMMEEYEEDLAMLDAEGPLWGIQETD